jgi:hypothetical protein
MIERMFGWKPEDASTPEYGARLSGEIPGLGGEPPLEVDNRFLVDEIYDQAMTSSCVAQSCALAIRAKYKAMTGQICPKPSRRWIYSLSRMFGAEEMVDDGTRLSSACGAMKALGWCSETVMPWNTWAINDMPHASAYRDAYDRRWVEGYYRPSDVGDSLEELAKQCCAAKHFMIFGIPVDQEFCDLTSLEPWSLTGAIKGRHAMVVCGYTSEGVIVASSWSEDFGAGGFAVIRWSQFKWSASDISIVTLVPGVG